MKFFDLKFTSPDLGYLRTKSAIRGKQFEFGQGSIIPIDARFISIRIQQ